MRAAIPDLKGLQLRAAGREVTLAVRPEWARAYPQSAHLLREEVAAWQKTAWSPTAEVNGINYIHRLLGT